MLSGWSLRSGRPEAFIHPTVTETVSFVQPILSAGRLYSHPAPVNKYDGPMACKALTFAGVAFLFANNPRPQRRQLPYGQLIQLLLIVFLASALFAVTGAGLGAHGWLAWSSRDLQAIVRDDLFRPQHFMAVYGMNLGGYVGGILATAGAIIQITRRRHSISNLRPAAA